ncbi:hypothetical protein HELRODRAFT_184550, partial [Helobdella robusta]|uniref:Uncharacterized protein n=1 Tax=Helobdella robusta TaxID=6412 RepID=T1FLG3_HELRO
MRESIVSIRSVDQVTWQDKRFWLGVRDPYSATHNIARSVFCWQVYDNIVKKFLFTFFHFRNVAAETRSPNSLLPFVISQSYVITTGSKDGELEVDNVADEKLKNARSLLSSYERSLLTYFFGNINYRTSL